MLWRRWRPRRSPKRSRSESAASSSDRLRVDKRGGWVCKYRRHRRKGSHRDDEPRRWRRPAARASRACHWKGSIAGEGPGAPGWARRRHTQTGRDTSPARGGELRRRATSPGPPRRNPARVPSRRRNPRAVAPGSASDSVTSCIRVVWSARAATTPRRGPETAARPWPRPTARRTAFHTRRKPARRLEKQLWILQSSRHLSANFSPILCKNWRDRCKQANAGKKIGVTLACNPLVPWWAILVSNQ